MNAHVGHKSLADALTSCLDQANSPIVTRLPFFVLKRFSRYFASGEYHINLISLFPTLSHLDVMVNRNGLIVTSKSGSRVSFRGAKL